MRTSKPLLLTLALGLAVGQWQVAAAQAPGLKDREAAALRKLRQQQAAQAEAAKAQKAAEDARKAEEARQAAAAAAEAARVKREAELAAQKEEQHKADWVRIENLPERHVVVFDALTSTESGRDDSGVTCRIRYFLHFQEQLPMHAAISIDDGLENTVADIIYLSDSHLTGNSEAYVYTNNYRLKPAAQGTTAVTSCVDLEAVYKDRIAKKNIRLYALWTPKYSFRSELFKPQLAGPDSRFSIEVGPAFALSSATERATLDTSTVPSGSSPSWDVTVPPDASGEWMASYIERLRRTARAIVPPTYETPIPSWDYWDGALNKFPSIGTYSAVVVCSLPYYSSVVRDCSVIRESPEGIGVGAAFQQGIKQLKITPARVAGEPVDTPSYWFSLKVISTE